MLSNIPNEEWNRTYNKYGYCCSVQLVDEKDYIITGLQSNDVFLMKIDEYGKELWTKKFGGRSLDWGFCVDQTSDNGFFIIGITDSFGAGGHDVWLIKTDYNGNEIWNRTFGGKKLDEAFSGEQTNDGGYIILGVTQSFVSEKNDFWLIKTDEDGYEIWNYTYGSIGWDIGISVQQTNDGGYIMTGAIDSSVDGSHQIDLGIIKTDPAGNIEWKKTFGDSTLQDQGLCIRQTEDNGFIVVGFRDAYQDSWQGGDVWLIKTDFNGKKIWETTIGGFGSDVGLSLCQTADGGYIISGKTDSFGFGEYDIFLVKTNCNGTQEWDMTFGGNQNEETNGFSCVKQTNDGGYIIVGSTETYGDINIGPELWVVKVPDPIISVKIEGGLYLSSYVYNLGEEDLNGLYWSMRIDTKLFQGKNSGGSIDFISAKSHTKIFRLFIFGFGKAIIRVKVEGIAQTRKSFLFGPIVFLE
jgi:hypothetical protein